MEMTAGATINSEIRKKKINLRLVHVQKRVGKVRTPHQNYHGRKILNSLQFQTSEANFSVYNETQSVLEYRLHKAGKTYNVIMKMTNSNLSLLSISEIPNSGCYQMADHLCTISKNTAIITKMDSVSS